MIVLGQALRFAIVGFAATVLHVLVAVGLIEIWNLHPSPANGAAFAVATVFAYLANTRWSFRAPLQGRSMVRYIVVSLFGLLLTLTLTAMIAAAGLPYLAGIAAVVTLVPVIGFVLHKQWTYRPY